MKKKKVQKSRWDMNYPKNTFLACDTMKYFRSLLTFGLMLWFFQSLLSLAMNVCTHWLQKELNFSPAAAASRAPALVLLNYPGQLKPHNCCVSDPRAGQEESEGIPVWYFQSGRHWRVECSAAEGNPRLQFCQLLRMLWKMGTCGKSEQTIQRERGEPQDT